MHHWGFETPAKQDRSFCDLPARLKVWCEGESVTLDRVLPLKQTTQDCGMDARPACKPVSKAKQLLTERKHRNPQDMQVIDESWAFKLQLLLSLVPVFAENCRHP